MAASHFETGDFSSKAVFPCFDDPYFKANITLTLIYPAKYVAISNTAEYNVVARTYGNGYNIITFPTTPRMSTYLLAFCTGELISLQANAADGTLIRVWAWQGMEEALRIPLQGAKDCFEWLSNFTDFKYPMAKLDHLALPQFPIEGGMENWGLIIYRYDYFLYNPKTDTTHDMIAGLGTRCHEMSHQWYGDLVTNDWWSEIMVHEAIARYFEVYAMGGTYPSQINYMDPYFTQRYMSEGFLYDSGPIYPDDRGNIFTPVVVPADSFNDVFTPITYDKGASLIRMIRATLGEEIFRKGMQGYLKKYAFGSGNHTTYFAALTEAVAGSNLTNQCGTLLDVNEFMDRWVNTPHFPALIVSFDDSTQTYTVQQETYLPLNLLPTEYHYSWEIPLWIQAINGSKTFQWIPQDDLMCPQAKKSAEVLPQILDNIQLFNADSSTFARIKYNDLALNRILSALWSDPAVVPLQSKIRLISDEWAWV